MEKVFRNQLVSKHQSLSGKALAISLPRNGQYVTIDLKQTDREDVDGIQLAEDRAVVNAIMNIRVE
jgi:hypothetical protein